MPDPAGGGAGVELEVGGGHGAVRVRRSPVTNAARIDGIDPGRGFVAEPREESRNQRAVMPVRVSKRFQLSTGIWARDACSKSRS